jgi:hypothetical protein
MTTTNPASNIPFVERKELVLPNSHPLPPDSAYTGRYRNRDDGELYASAIVENDPLGRSRKCKNTVHFWEGSEKEFNLAFEKA